MAFLLWLLMVGAAAAGVAASRVWIHYLQLESYQLAGYFRTMRRVFRQNLVRVCLPSVFLLAVELLAWFLLKIPGVFGALLSLLVLLLGGYGIFVYAGHQKAGESKKKLVFTARVKRLMAVEGIVLFLLQLFFRPGLSLAVCFLMPLLLPLWVALAALVAWPMEKGIQEMYFQDAKRMLDARHDLIKIGITGSYGKTSVKFILGTLLQEKYQTLITPGSFNTPMGLTKVIRSSLLPSHQVFVAEMGARHVGDIKELCRLVHPTMGVLTSVGPQHLDTFRTIERIRDTKYELVEALPDDGAAFFAEDRAICRELYNQTAKEKHLVSLEEEPEADVWAADLSTGPWGSRFRLCTREGEVACETRLLGRHAIQNILLAASVCLRLGMRLTQIRNGIANLQPVEHRLQLIRKPGNIHVIDDAYNSNPAGASAALQVLKAFPGRRIIITPGMVELGKDEETFNRTFGQEMADCTDIAILVGPKHTAPIREGLQAGGFDEKQIHTVQSLTEATALLGQMAEGGDTVLFENDLPDNYVET